MRQGSTKIRANRADKHGAGRFHRLNGAAFRVWAPPASRYRVEYSPALLREVKSQAALADASGLLYGVRENSTIRVVASRTAPSASDPRLAGLQPVGTFAARARGEVFLTEADLERFEKAESAALVALVIAGTKAGFFVHEPDGSLQSVRSHLEFPVDAPPEKPAARKKIAGKPFAAISLLAASLVAVLLAAALARPHSNPHPPRLDLAVHEQNGSVRVSWNPRALPPKAALEIRDGGERRSVDVTAMHQVTYARRSGDVEFRLAGESAHFLGADLPPSPLERLRRQVADLEAEARDLKAAAAIRTRRAAEINKILSTMDLDH